MKKFILSFISFASLAKFIRDFFSCSPSLLYGDHPPKAKELVVKRACGHVAMITLDGVEVYISLRYSRGIILYDEKSDTYYLTSNAHTDGHVQSDTKVPVFNICSERSEVIDITSLKTIHIDTTIDDQVKKSWETINTSSNP